MPVKSSSIRSNDFCHMPHRFQLFEAFSETCMRLLRIHLDADLSAARHRLNIYSRKHTSSKGYTDIRLVSSKGDSNKACCQHLMHCHRSKQDLIYDRVSSMRHLIIPRTFTRAATATSKTYKIPEVFGIQQRVPHCFLLHHTVSTMTGQDSFFTVSVAPVACCASCSRTASAAAASSRVTERSFLQSTGPIDVTELLLACLLRHLQPFDDCHKGVRVPSANRKVSMKLVCITSCSR